MGDDDVPMPVIPEGKRFGDWKTVKKLDEGGFGLVFKVENLKTKELGALKAESNQVEGGSAIKLEIRIINDLNGDGKKPHLPQVFYAAKKTSYCYMIMTLLGENLKHLRQACKDKGEKLSPGTWSRIAAQCLISIKYVHDGGYIHRDIKPNNFVMGATGDWSKQRLVHILDFGLARAYAFKHGNGWIARKARGTVEFRGTLRYCSPNVHAKKEQGRHDDLWSLYYVIVEFHHSTLPWVIEKNKEKVEAMKLRITDNVLVDMVKFPKEMAPILPHLRQLNCYERPDYLMIYNIFMDIMKKAKVKPSDPFDWETADELQKVRAKHPGPDAWENGTDFLKFDPIKIHGPPTKAEEAAFKSNKGAGTDRGQDGVNSKKSNLPTFGTNIHTEISMNEVTTSQRDKRISLKK